MAHGLGLLGGEPRFVSKPGVAPTPQYSQQPMLKLFAGQETPETTPVGYPNCVGAVFSTCRVAS